MIRRHSRLGLLTFAAVMTPALHAALAGQGSQYGSLSPVDYAFIGQTNQGNQYQIESGKVVLTSTTDPSVKSYAAQMVPSHEEVQQRLTRLLQRKNVTPPPTSLLASSFRAETDLLTSASGVSRDAIYVREQVAYQVGNDELYRWEIANGTDAQLKAFAKVVLVEVDKHLAIAKSLPDGPP